MQWPVLSTRFQILFSFSDLVLSHCHPKRTSFTRSPRCLSGVQATIQVLTLKRRLQRHVFISKHKDHACILRTLVITLIRLLLPLYMQWPVQNNFRTFNTTCFYFSPTPEATLRSSSWPQCWPCVPCAVKGVPTFEVQKNYPKEELHTIKKLLS